MLSSRLVLILALAACGGTQSPPPTVQNEAPPEPAAPPAPPPKTKIEEAMEKMGSLADSMCTCKDKPCAEKVQAEMTAWSTKMAEEGGDRETKPTEADMKQMTELGMRYAECMTTAMTAP